MAGLRDNERVTWLGAGAHRQFLHATAICETMAAFELGLTARPGLRFVSWSEMLARAPETTRRAAHPFQLKSPLGGLVPDALFGIEYCAIGRTPLYRFFAVETDRATMPIVRTRAGPTSYVAKLGVYRRFMDAGLHRVQLGIPNLFVLTITVSAILVVIEEACSPEAARRLGGLKKTEMSQAAENMVRDKRWVPSPLRTPPARYGTAAIFVYCAYELVRRTEHRASSIG